MQNRHVALVLDTTNPHQRKIAQGVGAYAHGPGGWRLHVVQDPLENLPYATLDPLEGPYDVRAWRPDGIIGHFSSRRVIAAAHRLAIPIVGIEGEYGVGSRQSDIPYFDTDNAAIGRLGATELIERGLRHLAFCSVPHSRRTGWSQQRQHAFEACAQEAGVPCSVFGGGRRTCDAGETRRELAAWLGSLPKPVGVMACYDVRARHVLMVCRDAGILVPEEVAVIGVDNYELMCELTDPSLSSIEQGARTMGREAAALLDRLMDGQKSPQQKYVVKPEGVVSRRSSDSLAIDDADVAATLRFIRNHACEGIRVAEVIEAVAVSRSSLDARFKAVVGRTIHAEIQRVRIERARQLVTATDLPLARVAADAGFRYLQQMTAAFRAHTGQPPGEYRKRSRL